MPAVLIPMERRSLFVLFKTFLTVFLTPFQIFSRIIQRHRNDRQDNCRNKNTDRKQNDHRSHQ